MTAGRGRLRVGACLSLSGRYGRFGRQAGTALTAVAALDGAIDLVIEDDESDRRRLEAALGGVARRCDLLLGPYSTQLARAAGRLAAEAGWMLWNHGGSGDDVEAAYPGHVASVLTPTARYAEPFMGYLARQPDRTPLWVIEGKGSFGRQVAGGAVATAQRLGIDTVVVGPDDAQRSADPASTWDVFTAGTFEDDVETVRALLRLPHPPRHLCTVAAGVREFADMAGEPEGVLGIAQWVPGTELDPRLGPTEDEFLTAYAKVAQPTPDYVAVQAAAAVVVAIHCARQAGTTACRDLWSIASDLDTTTLFGGFKVDPHTCSQLRHETVLTRWTDQGLTRV